MRPKFNPSVGRLEVTPEAATCVEFDRTISRLVEMQSTEYLALPHLA